MLTKAETKLIRSLREKKHRAETGLFLVEGAKSVEELLRSNFAISFIVATDAFAKTLKTKMRVETVSADELAKLGTLEANDAAIAVVKQKSAQTAEQKNQGLILVLDEVKDPGNLGTIIRIADWYGVKRILASKGTADFYNAKTIAASMGSFTRIAVEYADLAEFFSKNTLPVFGAYLGGENVHEMKFPSDGILVMGNESNGISAHLEKFITKKITIPRYGSAESLNVAIATAVILDNWKRK
ncbi:MAG: RNA methyltransferase [Patescibacteria group bacterium]|nr:RNA methyltransferase [Patescibacteria group bacterium]MDE1945681.1 RNA methyltransferase [Patescibacteria group bacterium]